MKIRPHFVILWLSLVHLRGYSYNETLLSPVLNVGSSGTWIRYSPNIINAVKGARFTIETIRIEGRNMNTESEVYVTSSEESRRKLAAWLKRDIGKLIDRQPVDNGEPKKAFIFLQTFQADLYATDLPKEDALLLSVPFERVFARFTKEVFLKLMDELKCEKEK